MKNNDTRTLSIFIFFIQKSGNVNLFHTFRIASCLLFYWCLMVVLNKFINIDGNKWQNGKGWEGRKKSTSRNFQRGTRNIPGVNIFQSHVLFVSSFFLWGQKSVICQTAYDYGMSLEFEKLKNFKNAASTMRPQVRFYDDVWMEFR